MGDERHLSLPLDIGGGGEGGGSGGAGGGTWTVVGLGGGTPEEPDGDGPTSDSGPVIIDRFNDRLVASPTLSAGASVGSFAVAGKAEALGASSSEHGSSIPGRATLTTASRVQLEAWQAHRFGSWHCQAQTVDGSPDVVIGCGAAPRARLLLDRLRPARAVVEGGGRSAPGRHGRHVLHDDSRRSADIPWRAPRGGRPGRSWCVDPSPSRWAGHVGGHRSRHGAARRPSSSPAATSPPREGRYTSDIVPLGASIEWRHFRILLRLARLATCHGRDRGTVRGLFGVTGAGGTPASPGVAGLLRDRCRLRDTIDTGDPRSAGRIVGACREEGGSVLRDRRGRALCREHAPASKTSRSTDRTRMRMPTTAHGPRMTAGA